MVKTGMRASIQRTTGLVNSLLCRPMAMGRSSADPNLLVGGEDVLGYRQVGRGRPPPDASRGVVHAAMAGAEPSAILAARIGGLLAERHAAEMRADADHDQPGILLHPRLVRRRIRQGGERDGARLLDLLF